MWISRRSEEPDGSLNLSSLPSDLVDGNISSLLLNSSLELVDGCPSISSLPLELLETILSFLSEPSSQLQASQVCSRWQDAMAHLWWKNLMTWERKPNYKCNRPLFSTPAPSAEKCALIVQVSVSVQLVGVVAVLPSQWQGEGTLSVSSYASPNCGPQGPFLGQVIFQSSQHIQIGGNKSCADGGSEKYEDEEGSAGHHINVLLPYPLHLMPQVYYQLELCIFTKSRCDVTMTEKSHGYDDTVKCVKEVKLFGRSSPPVRSEEEKVALEKPLRWFEMKRDGLQPVGGQLPIIYYIP